MIERKRFVVEYPVSHDMDISEPRKAAREEVMAQLNTWASSQNRKIISIQENSFSSSNSDDSPFWVGVTVFFE